MGGDCGEGFAFKSDWAKVYAKMEPRRWR